MNQIKDRFCAVIVANTRDGRRWSELAALSGIPATSWQKAYIGKQRPTVEMIECVARLWPTYAFWLATGITDARHGHVSCRDGNIGPFFPETDEAVVPRVAAKPYFEQGLLMFQRVYGEGLSLADTVGRNEERVRFLVAALARNAEEENLSKGEHEVLIEELEMAKTALRQSRLEKSIDQIDELGDISRLGSDLRKPDQAGETPIAWPFDKPQG